MGKCAARCFFGRVLSQLTHRVSNLAHRLNIEMPGKREQELKRRLASVLWDAVEECVRRLDSESMNEKVRK